MSVCFEVILIGQDGGNETYNIGDIVNAYPADQMGTWDGLKYNRPSVDMPKTGLIFVTGFPVVFTEPIEVVRRSLCRATVDGLNKRLWGIVINEMPLPFRNDFLTNKFITLNWGQFKAFTREKLGSALLTDNALNNLPPDVLV